MTVGVAEARWRPPVSCLACLTTAGGAPTLLINDRLRPTSVAFHQLERERPVIVIPGGILDAHGPFLPA